MEPRRCIHGRTEKQRCKLCSLRSQCCNGAVYLSEKAYSCETCGKACDVYKEGEALKVMQECREITKPAG